ncbi:hypothetical protein N8T08_009669 [Aspergillus melleus]|uniref:Uncharacterized protein n=1 Tax=Aspergillus melleus TaxID=138277 RepID=A0ACC3ATF1_9EURO|nr:hypothetical protein N8T08_009669 [Aspergillus melleus]
MGFLTYLCLKFGAILLRAFARLQGKITSNPDESPSDLPHPVLINLHGSGFVIPAHGSDDAFCRQVSQRTGYLVLDIKYRLSPEHPFPAPVDDVEDVVNWVKSQPNKFDLSRMAISGFSAGGFADLGRFPSNIMIISAGHDSLAPEAERLARRLQEDTTRHVVHERMTECDHAWDKTAKKGTKRWELRDKAYKAAIQALLR